MATGATGQLGLALPVQGELSGTWGDTVNNGITQYTNIAIAGTLTLTGDGAVTLSNTTGDASASNIVSTLTGAGTVTAQFAIVRVTGTLTVAKVVTAPSYSKTYTVVNAATGGIVTFKASGQTGVSVAVGESAFVYFNGTDYVKIVGTATAGAAGGSTTQVQFNSSGVLAGSANMTFDGTSLTLGGNPTLSAGTANGVTYLNGSKVLTSGSALVFDGTNLGVGVTPSDKIDVAGTSRWRARVTNAYTLQINTNAAGASYADAYYDALSHLWQISGSDGMRLTSTGLGIGTSSPASALDVQAANGQSIVRLTATTGTNPVYSRASNTGGFLYIGRDGSTGSDFGSAYAAGIWSTGAYPMLFGTNGTEKMRLDSAGNLGLGITPSAWYTSGSSVAQVRQASFYAVDNIALEIGNNAFLTSGGSTWNYINTGFATRYNSSSGKHIWFNAPSGTAGNAVTFTQAMTLDASGRLGIGSTSPTRPLTIQAAGAAYPSASNPSIRLDNTASGRFAVIESASDSNLYIVNGDADDASTIFRRGSGAGNESFRFGPSGQLGVAGANYGTSGQVLTSGGSGAAPTWTTVSGGGSPGGSTTQIQYNNAGAFAGSANFVWDNTNTRLGIGTSSPQRTFCIQNGGPVVEIDPAGVSSNPIYFNYNRTTSTYLTPQYWALAHIWNYNGGTEGMRLDSSGNLGLGVTPKTWTLGTIMQIGATSAFWNFSGSAFVTSNRYYNGGNKRIASGYSTTYEQNSTDGSHYWTVAGTGAADSAITATNAMTLNTNGVLLVGTTTSSASNGALQVQTPNNQTSAIEVKTNSGATGNGGSMGMLSDGLYITANYYYTSGQYKRVAANGSTSLFLGAGTNDADTYMSFSTGTTAQTQPTEKARIDSSGNFFVGTTTITSSGWVQLTTSNTKYSIVSRSSVSGAGAFVACANSAGTLVGSITFDNIATAFNTSSDYRLKNTIAPMTGALAKVAQLKPVTYKWNIDDSDGQGFIAHELAEVVPQCVTGKKDALDEDGNPKYQGIDTSFLVATLTAAIQEQQAIIESLKARLDAANL